MKAKLAALLFLAILMTGTISAGHGTNGNNLFVGMNYDVERDVWLLNHLTTNPENSHEFLGSFGHPNKEGRCSIYVKEEDPGLLSGSAEKAVVRVPGGYTVGSEFTDVSSSQKHHFKERDEPWTAIEVWEELTSDNFFDGGTRFNWRASAQLLKQAENENKERELKGELICDPDPADNEEAVWKQCDSEQDSSVEIGGTEYTCSSGEWTIASSSSGSGQDDSDSAGECAEDEKWSDRLGGCIPDDTDTGDSDGDGSNSADDVDCSEVSNPNLYPDCTGGENDNSVDEGDSGEEVNCSEVSNPNLYPSCTGGGSQIDSGTDTETGTEISVELTKAEWAAFASVDPEYITGENVSNLNTAYNSKSDAVQAARKAAEGNGWLADITEEYNTYIELESDYPGSVEEPDPGFAAADGTKLVTDGTASPYESDGCYTDTEYEPLSYGDAGSEVIPPEFGGSAWSPGDFECPSWMNEVNWSELETLERAENVGSGSCAGDERWSPRLGGCVPEGAETTPDPTEDPGETGESDTNEDVTNLEISAEGITGFSWKTYCTDNADSIGINPEDGISTDEAVSCLQPCWGASNDKQTPHSSDATCGQLIKDFCEPYYTYSSEANKCEVN